MEVFFRRCIIFLHVCLIMLLTEDLCVWYLFSYLYDVVLLFMVVCSCGLKKCMCGVSLLCPYGLRLF